MADPAVVEEGAKKELPKILTAPKKGFQKMVAACKGRPSLWAALIVLLLGIVGQILLVVLPGRYFVQTEAGVVFYDRYQLLNALNLAAQALTYLGAVWFGVLLAYWAILKKKSQQGS